MVKEDIQTVIDRLSDYITAGGSVTLKDASRAVARKPAQVERFALLLEEAGIIEVRYSLTGVRLVAKKKKSAIAAAPAKTLQSSQAVEEADRLEREVMTSENLLKFFEADIERRINLSETMLKDLEVRDGFTLEELNHLRTEVDLALKQVESFSGEIKKLGEREQGFQSRLKEFRERIEHIQVTAEPSPRRKGVAGIVAAINSVIDALIDLIIGRKKAKPQTASPVVEAANAGLEAAKPPAAEEQKPKAEALVPVRPTAPKPEQSSFQAPVRNYRLPFSPSNRSRVTAGVRKKFVVKRRRG